MRQRAYRAVFFSAPDAVVVVDQRGVMVDVNRQAEEFFGYPRSELVGQAVEMLIPYELGDRHRGHRARFLDAPATRRMGAGHSDLRARRADGSTVPVDVSLSPLDDAGEGLVAAAVRDIRPHRRAEARFQRIFRDSPVGMAVIDRDGRFAEVNPAMARLLSCDPAELVGKGFADIRPSEDVRRDEDLTREVLAGETSTFSIEKRYVGMTGRVVWVELTVASLMTDDGPEAMAMLQDITERKANEARLLHTATHDQLTGVANRAIVTDRLRQSLARARRSGEHVAVLFIDLDHLKEVNDSLGHAAGDEVLVAVAQRIQALLRPSDSVARLGGDEFLVCCDGLDIRAESALAEAVMLGERVRETVGEPIHLSSGNTGTTASIGIAVAGAEVPHYTLIQTADRLMYDAKAAGRNACRWAVLSSAEAAQPEAVAHNENA